jgi:hypothetical protein
MKIRHVSNQTDYFLDDYSSYFALAERPYKCTCFCLERPEVTVKNNNINFGKIVEPFSCCDPLFVIRDAQQNIRWKITANCCQCGFSCPACANVVFTIHSGNQEILDPNAAEGTITKTSAGIQELVSEADNFDVVFPVNATPEDKLLIIINVLMIDFRYFESETDNKNH